MTRYTICPGCEKEQNLKLAGATRGEAQMNQGDEASFNCKECGTQAAVHLNKIYAKVDKKIILLGLVISVVLTGILWVFYGAIGTVTLVIPILFWQQQEKAVRSFNNFKIKRK